MLGRTVDAVVAAMEANHPHLMTQKMLYAENRWARECAELLADERNPPHERLETAAEERVAALEAIDPELTDPQTRSGGGTRS